MLNDDFIRDLSSRPAFEHLTLLVGCGVTRLACDSVTEYSFTALSRTHIRRKQRTSPSIQRGCQACQTAGSFCCNAPNLSGGALQRKFPWAMPLFPSDSSTANVRAPIAPPYC